MKRIFIAVFIMMLGFMAIGLPQMTNIAGAYDPLNKVCTDDNGNTINNGVCLQASSQGNTNPVIDVINTAIKILGWVVGVASVILVMIGGFSYITSAGNPEKTATAKKRIIYALVGLLIAALAWAIVHFVINRIL